MTTCHVTPDTRCAVPGCETPQLDGLHYERGRWLCYHHAPELRCSHGCTRADAYSHTATQGFLCKHGEAV